VSPAPAIGVVTGRTWVFPEANINSDIILPAAWTQVRTEEEQQRLLFKNYRPEWIDQVAEGDIVIGGKNFGTGSGRPGAPLMRRAGVVAVAADSINDLFYRNCVNAAVLPLECPGVSTAVQEGDVVTLDVLYGRLRNTRTGEELPGTPVPEVLLDIIAKGGLIAQLRADGLIR
jgi:3-isopropylmalate/(R)-2-methylmalate dehydratase small subunit